MSASLWPHGACQAPLSLGFSRQECWSGLPFPSQGDLPDPGIEPKSIVAPALAGRFFPTRPPGKPLLIIIITNTLCFFSVFNSHALSIYCMPGTSIRRGSKRQRRWLPLCHLQSREWLPLYFIADVALHLSNPFLGLSRQFFSFIYFLLQYSCFTKLC